MMCEAFQALFNEDGTPTDAFINAVQVIPVGMVLWRASSIVPNGWLACNGQAVARETYPLLFATIGTTYGIGNGSTTFNVPDLRDKFQCGASNTKPIDVTGGGAATHTLTVAELPAHEHETGSVTIPDNAKIVTQDWAIGDQTAGGGNEGDEPFNRVNAKTLFDAIGGASAGGGSAHNNLPPYLAGTFMIKT